MSLSITQKIDALANLTAANKIYPAGMIIISTDKTIFKVADGVTSFNNLTNLRAV
jgi:ribosomal protein L27